MVVAPVPTGTDRFHALHALPEGERDLVEPLMVLMIGAGTLVGAVELSLRPLHDLVDEYGSPAVSLKGLTFPVFSWLTDQAGGYAMHLVAIDQGDVRVCFRVRRRRGYGLL